MNTPLPIIAVEPVPLLCSDIEVLNTYDLAQALSQLNRHNGRTLRPISEAEHAVHVMTVLETDYNVTDPCVLLAGLLHNAHTSFTGSLGIGICTVLGPAWRFIESGTRAAVMRHFMVQTAHRSHHSQIDGAASFVVSAECTQLMLHSNHEHRNLVKSRPAPNWLNLGSCSSHAADEWCQVYLANLNALQDEIAQRHRAQSHPNTKA